MAAACQDGGFVLKTGLAECGQVNPSIYNTSITDLGLPRTAVPQSQQRKECSTPPGPQE